METAPAAGPPEPEEARPWRESNGPAPKVSMWPAGDRPALEVFSHGAWRYAPVLAWQDYVDGRVVYQVEVDLRGDTSVTARLYQWPQPGLRRAHGTRGAQPGTGPGR